MTRMGGAFIKHLELPGLKPFAQALLKLECSELAHVSPPARRP